MAGEVERTLDDVLDACIQRDAELARDVRLRDAVADQMSAYLPTLPFQATLGMNLRRMLDDAGPIFVLANVAVWGDFPRSALNRSIRYTTG